jgi:hypothetical protein
MAGPNDPMEMLRGLRVLSAGKPAGQGKEMGAAPTPLSMEGPKAMTVVVRV